ncbi:MAG TPA: hypothetical protein VNY80_15690 [Steroidobacteraceae bacterium]|nr:hypothetical protein [Steroidobacteraceae bacterium]
MPIWKKEHYENGDSGWVNCERCAAPAQHTHTAQRTQAVQHTHSAQHHDHAAVSTPK